MDKTILTSIENDKNNTIKTLSLDIKSSDSDILEVLSNWEAIGSDFLEEAKKDTVNNLSWYTGELNEDIDELKSNVYDNRIFMSVETIVPIVTSKPAMPIVHNRNTSQSKEEGEELTKMHQKILIAEYEKQGMQEKLESLIRNWFINKVGIVRYSISNGVINTRVVDPRNIIIDSTAKDIQSSYFIGEIKQVLAEDILVKYPKKERDIIDKTGGKKYLGTKLEIKEWRTKNYYVVQLEDIILDKGVNEYFDFDGVKKIVNEYGEEIIDGNNKNFFQYPRIPYISLNVYTLDKKIKDATTPLIQSIKLQNCLNNRLRQVDDAGETIANALLVGKGITQEELDLINSRKKAGDAVSLAQDTDLSYLKAEALPNYVQNAIQDARNEIDNLFGTHSTTRGERTSQETATGREILRQGDEDRQALLGRALERLSKELYNSWTQLIILFYDEDKLTRLLGKKDAKKYLKYISNNKNDGIEISVVPGTMLPDDKIAVRQEALQLAQMGLITKEELYKRLGWEEAKEKADELQKEAAITQKKQQEILAQQEQIKAGAQQGQADLQGIMQQIQGL